MDMSSMSMDMGSATTSMAMAHSTMDHAHMSGMNHMSMDHSSMDHGSMGHGSMGNSSDMGGMDMGGMDHSMMGMNMWLTTTYRDYPVLFKNLKANNGGQAFGIFLLFFVVGFLGKGCEFLKNYLEVKVWHNPIYNRQTIIIDECACDDEEAGSGKVLESLERQETPVSHSFFTYLIRDCIRIILVFISEMFGYALMLVAMTFSLVYFFSVILGNTFGRVFFEKLSNKLEILPGANNFAGHH